MNDNKKRLIDANALKERAVRVSTVKEMGNQPHCYFKAVGTHEIDKAPTVDAVEVVHGHWIPQKHEDEFVEYVVQVCSVCGCPHSAESNFCSYCGAKMKE